MSQVKGQLIQHVPQLAGVWQFSVPTGDYLGIVANHQPGVELSLYLRSSRGWTTKRTLPLDGPVYASDACLVGTEMFMCWERNHDRALQFGKWQVRDLLSDKPAPIELLGEMGLSEGQSSRLAPSQPWSVSSTLPPERWLFAPKWVRGDRTLVVANTADGQTMMFMPGSGDRSKPDMQALLYGKPSRPALPPPPPEIDSYSIPNALGPQSMVFQDRRYVAFKQVANAVQPFFLRSRHDGRTTSTPGELMVKEVGDVPQNLSALLKLGPVTSLSLTTGAGHVPWIFAVRPALAGCEVVAIAQERSIWTVKARKPIDNLVQELTVWRGSDGFHMVYATKEKEGWSVWHIPWLGL